jgi:hypothetical protein
MWDEHPVCHVPCRQSLRSAGERGLAKWFDRGNVSNINFTKLSALTSALTKNPKVKSVKNALKGTEGTLAIEHSGSTDELIENLSKVPALKFEVSELEEGKAKIAMQ